MAGSFTLGAATRRPPRQPTGLWWWIGGGLGDAKAASAARTLAAPANDSSPYPFRQVPLAPGGATDADLTLAAVPPVTQCIDKALSECIREIVAGSSAPSRSLR